MYIFSLKSIENIQNLMRVDITHFMRTESLIDNSNLECEVIHFNYYLVLWKNYY